MLAQEDSEMGLLHLVLLHLVVRHHLHREDVFSFLACYVIQYMEKSRACANGNIINMTATVNIRAHMDQDFSRLCCNLAT